MSLCVPDAVFIDCLDFYKRLQGKAGPRQVKNPQLGLTHKIGGSHGHLYMQCQNRRKLAATQRGLLFQRDVKRVSREEINRFIHLLM